MQAATSSCEAAKSFVLVGAVYLDIILNVNEYPREDDKLRASNVTRRLGGNSGNSSVVLSKLCNKEAKDSQSQVWFLGKLRQGDVDNPDASAIIQTLRTHHVDTSLCLTIESSEPPTAWIIRSDTTGSRTIINYNTFPELTSSEFKDAWIRGCQQHGEHTKPFSRWVHFEGRRNSKDVVQMIQFLRRQYRCRSTIPETSHPVGYAVHTTKQQQIDLGISVECEKNYNGLDEVMQVADVVFFSKVYAEGKGYSFSGKSREDQRHEAELFLSKWVRERVLPWAACYITLGEIGALCLENDSSRSNPIYFVKAPTVSVVDSIGAGDTFNAAIMFRLSSGATPHEALEYATMMASKKVSMQGFDGL
ncbi:Ribokinase-like protein [Paraphysoderma sedebokerense]|nr:Ribokinase-like protein [Paraphysoderma sedebokerense]